MMSHSASAPETMRIDVKLAASMPVLPSATRQRREFPAKAIIARNVRMTSRMAMIGARALLSSQRNLYRVVQTNRGAHHPELK